jgi:hypothetical protein
LPPQTLDADAARSPNELQLNCRLSGINALFRKALAYAARFNWAVGCKLLQFLAT